MPSNQDLLQQAISQHLAHKMVQNTAPERELRAKAKVAAEPQQEQYGLIPTIARKGLQGFSYGTADEGLAAAKAGLDFATGNGFNYDQRLAEERQILKDMDQQHPYVSGAASIAGNMVSPISKLGGAATVLGGALKTGLLAAGQGFAEGEGGLANRADKALKEGAAGAAVSAALGAAGKGISKVFSEDSAGKAATRALGGTGSQYQEFKDLPGGAERVGQKLLDQKIVRGSDNVYETAARVQKGLDEAGVRIGKVVKQADQLVAQGKAPALDPFKVFNAASKEMKDLLEKNPNREQIWAAIQPRLQVFMDDFIKPTLAKGGKPQMSYDDLQQFQAKFSNFYDKNSSSAANEALQKLEGVFSRELSKGLNRVSRSQGSTQFVREYLSAKQQFRMLKMAQQAAEQGVKAADQRSIKAMEVALGGAGAIGSLAYGNVPAALIMGAAPFLKKPVLNQGPNILASMLNKGADLVGSAAQHTPAAQQAGRATLLEVLRQVGGQ